MPRHSRASLFAALLLLSPGATAAADCDPADAARTPDQVALRIDHYRQATRGPGTYRALAGLGDPDIQDNSGDGRLYDLSPQERALAGRMLPQLRGLQFLSSYELGECRIGYALSLAGNRVARFGRDHPYVMQWFAVQRAVFTACIGRASWQIPSEERARPGPPVALPPPLPTADPEIARLQREDRAYQAASLLFYRRDPGARRAFREIAATASPHAHIARYMLAAIEARDVEVYGWSAGPQAQAARAERAAAALREAQAIMADPRLADIHALTQGLIGFLGYHNGDARTRRTQVLTTLEALEAPLDRIRANPVAADRYARAVHDVHALHARLNDEAWWLTGAVPAGMDASATMAEQARRRPFAAWLLFPDSYFERQPWAVRRPSGTDWRLLDEHADRQAEHETGQAWALIRLSLAQSYDPARWDEVDTLTRAAQSCPSNDRLAALAALFYHQARAALMYPVLDENWRPVARQEGFARALAHLQSWPWRDSMHYRELVSDMLQYLVAEGRIDEARLLRDRIRPRGDGYGETTTALLLLAANEDEFAAELPSLQGGGQALENLLSVEALTRLAARTDVAAPERARFARVAWTRLYALQRPIPRRLDRLMRQLNPEITSGWISRPGARPGSRRLLLDVLRSPGLNILITEHQRDPAVQWRQSDLNSIDVYEHSDNNWWCAWQPERHGGSASSAMYYAFFGPVAGDFDPLAVAGAPVALRPLLGRSWLWQSQDEAEQAALARIKSAPQLLAERAVAWRGSGWLSFGGRDGQDEALALAVRATRYGCQRQGGHGAWSRAAYTLLHSRFPQSEAARRTRYWFDCAHFSYGCRPEDWSR